MTNSTKFNLSSRKLLFKNRRHNRLRTGRADRVHKKIRSPSAGNAKLKIIRREPRSPFGGIRYVAGMAQGEGREGFARLRAVESGAFGFAEGAESAGTLLDDPGRNVIWKRGGAS